tara:strand:+ start:53 stop:340 length:288 start_codon:yes stop_codon:yes gene_type:complete
MSLKIEVKLLPPIFTREGKLPDYHLVGSVIRDGELTGEKLHAHYSLPLHFLTFPKTRFIHGDITPRKRASWENMALRKCLEKMSKHLMLYAGVDE